MAHCDPLTKSDDPERTDASNSNKCEDLTRKSAWNECQ